RELFAVSDLQHDDHRRPASGLRKRPRSVALPARGPVPLPVGQQSKERGLGIEAWGFLGKRHFGLGMGRKCPKSSRI
ncbi:hypothetical protein IscW_ISCW019710, partial [Ixodes scapularis]